MAMKRTSIAIILLAGLTLLSGCDETGKILAGETDIIPSSRAPLPKTSTWTGQMSRAESLQYVTAHDDAGWQKLWQIVGQPPPLASLPKGWMGAAVFLGQRPTEGYAAQITNVSDQWAPGLPDILVVHYIEVIPPKKPPTPVPGATVAAPTANVEAPAANTDSSALPQTTVPDDAASSQSPANTIPAPVPSTHLTSPWVVRLVPAQKFDPEYQKG